jgi:hypothetical protein
MTGEVVGGNEDIPLQMDNCALDIHAIVVEFNAGGVKDLLLGIKVESGDECI